MTSIPPTAVAAPMAKPPAANPWAVINQAATALTMKNPDKMPAASRQAKALDIATSAVEGFKAVQANPNNNVWVRNNAGTGLADAQRGIDALTPNVGMLVHHQRIALSPETLLANVATARAAFFSAVGSAALE